MRTLVIGDLHFDNTKNYVKVYLKSDLDISGKILKVKIKSYENDRLIAEII